MDERHGAAQMLSRIDAELFALHGQVGPDWVNTLFPPGKSRSIGDYTLRDGHEVRIRMIEQWFFYDGLLDGLPTERYNRYFFIEWAIDSIHPSSAFFLSTL